MVGYYRRYLARLWTEMKSKVYDFLAAIVATALMFYFGGPIDPAKGIADLLFKVWPLLLFVAVNILRTPCLLDKEKQSELENVQGKLQEEKDKNVKPELVGKATDFRLGGDGTSITRSEKGDAVILDLMFAIDVTNRRSTQTNVVGIHIDPSWIDPDARVSNIRHRAKDQVLEHGLMKRVQVSVYLNMPAKVPGDNGFWTKDHAIDVSALKVFMVDTFDQRYPVEMPRKAVVFPS